MAISKIPNVYYFDALGKVDPEQITGDAIILIKMQAVADESAKQSYPANKFPVTAYFIKNKQFITKQSQDKKRAEVALSQLDWNLVQQHIDVATGKVNIINEPPSSLYNTICLLAAKASFPYVHTTLYLARNGKSVELYCFNLPHRKPTEADNIHPALKEYLQKTMNGSDYNLLTLLYKIKVHTNFEQSIEFYQKGGGLLNFGLTNVPARKINIDEMIQLVHKASGTKFMTFVELEHEVDKIKGRFKESPLTQSKAAVWVSFLAFYRANQSDPGMMPRSVMVAAWVNNYKQLNSNQNPFTTLNTHRRTEGFLSLFNPKITDSIDLFNKFLAGETVPETLKQLMQEQPQSKTLTLSY